MQNFFSGLNDFIKRPYRGEEMDAFQWFLFLGLILALLTAWAWLLNRVQ